MGTRSMEPLKIMANAGSQEAINSLVEGIFQHRDAVALPEGQALKWQESLSASSADIYSMFVAARYLIQECLYFDGVTPSKILPGGFDATLSSMLDKAVATLRPAALAQLTSTPVSLPQLLDVDWRVDVKTAANTVSRMAAPTALVELQLAMPPTRSGVMGEVKSVTAEMNGETLQTMLDGLTKIREQLSAV